MSYKAKVLPLARQDIKEAAEWYEGRSKGLGNRFSSNVRQKINFICQNPYPLAIRYDDIRTAILETFPYMVHFTVVEQQKLVIITAVLSTHRNPDLWKER